ncbi:MAG: sulfatase/phosphatase domain-containing protein, partial [Armatimonadota bacterium]
LTSHSEPEAHLTMVRTDQHKLVAVHGRDGGELYDLETDPTETHNLWNDAGHRNVKTEMLERLCDRLAWTVDPLPLREGPW